jgi:hypothetical protein
MKVLALLLLGASTVVAQPTASEAPPEASAFGGLTPVAAPNISKRPVVDTQHSPARYKTRITPERSDLGAAPTDAVTQRMATREELGTAVLARGLALQPSLRFGNVGGGIRKAWDAAETHPPVSLRVGKQWEPEAGASDFTRLAFGDLTDNELLLHWRKRGAAFYHDLPLVHGGKKWIRHRYLYYFQAGYDGWGGRLQPHVVWVEVRERLEPTEAEYSQWIARARSELAEKAAALERLIAGGGPQAEGAKGVLERVRALAEGEPPVPLHLAVDQVILADPMPVRGGTPWKIRVHRADELEWEGDRPILYVAESSHRFVVRPKALTWREECDPPWIREPREGGKLPLLDLRDHRHPENPVAARDRGDKVPHLPGFVDSPVMILGFDGALRMNPLSFEDPPEWWVAELRTADRLAAASGNVAPDAPDPEAPSGAAPGASTAAPAQPER